MFFEEALVKTISRILNANTVNKHEGHLTIRWSRVQQFEQPRWVTGIRLNFGIWDALVNVKNVG